MVLRTSPPQAPRARPALLQLRLSNFEANFSNPGTPVASKFDTRPTTPTPLSQSFTADSLQVPTLQVPSSANSNSKSKRRGGGGGGTHLTVPHSAPLGTRSLPGTPFATKFDKSELNRFDLSRLAPPLTAVPRTPRTPSTPRPFKPASEMEITDIPKLHQTSLFFPWDRGLKRYLRAQGLDAHITRAAPPEPFRVDYEGGSQWEREIIRPEGDFAGKKPPSGRALEGGGELSDDEKKEWATWARNELRTRQAILKSVAGSMIMELNVLWSSYDIYTTLRERYTDDRAHRALVWRFLRLRLPHGEEITCDRLRQHAAEFAGMVNELAGMGRPREDSQIVAQFMSSIPEEIALSLMTSLQTARGDAWPVIHKAYGNIVRGLEAQEVTKNRRRGRRGQGHPYHANYGKKIQAQFPPEKE